MSVSPSVATPHVSGGPAIQVDELRVALGGSEIVHGVTFEVQQGDVFGFIGPNGAGKTTTIRALLGLYQPVSGAATILGHPAGTDRARALRGFALDQDGLYGDLSAAQNVAFFRSLYGCRRDPHHVEHVLAQVGLADRAEDKVRTFSRGMRQRVAIARAIAHDPQVIILDEPTSGVDPIAQSQLHELIGGLARSHGMTVFLSSHNLDEVQLLCNRIALIAQGRILLSGDLGELSAQAGHNEITVTTQAPVDDDTAAALRAEPALGVHDVRSTYLLLRPAPSESVSAVVGLLAAHGVEAASLTSNHARLDQIFQEAVTKASAEAAQARPPVARGPHGRKRRGQRS